VRSGLLYFEEHFIIISSRLQMIQTMYPVASNSKVDPSYQNTISFARAIATLEYPLPKPLSLHVDVSNEI